MNKLLLFLILIGSGILRLYNNTSVSLWHDEAFSALYLRYDWGEMMDRIILDVHPPLYYIILRFWSYAFGDSLLALRGFSILFGVLTVWAGWLFARRAFKSERLALLAALFLAINPFQIQYALEARMYTLGTFLVMLSSWLLLRALDSRRKRDWLWYAAAAAAGLYTHYYIIFSVLAQGLYALYAVWRSKSYRLPLKENQLANLLLAAAATVVFYLPWLPAFLEQLNRVQGGYWIPPMDRWAIPGTLWKMLLGGQGINRPALVAATAAVLLVAWYFVRRVQEREKWLVVSTVAVPFAAAIALSLKNDIYLDRYFVFASLSLSVMVAGAVFAVSKAGWRRLAAGLFAAASLAAFWQNWQALGVKDFGSGINRKPGMAAAADYLNENALPGQKIYVGSSLIFFTFKYYNDTGTEPKLISGAPLENIPHYAGTAIMSEEDLVLEPTLFDQDAHQPNEIIWLLWTTGWGGSKPNVPWVKIGERSWQDAPGFKGEVFVTQYRVE